MPNAFDYPIFSRVTLTCTVTSNSGSIPNGISYGWNTTGCYTNNKFTPGNPECFPHGQPLQSVTENNLNAEDAGTISCTVMIGSTTYESAAFTLRVSGEQLMYCVITCNVTFSHLRSKERAVLQISCSPPQCIIIIMHCSRVQYNYNTLHRAI